MTTTTEKAKGRKIYINDDLYRRLKLSATEQGKTISQVTVEILDSRLPQFAVLAWDNNEVTR
tara:strand:+ start:481 stop:666 length:186 start_codon:yes stop_codon:yes gene_type:complete